MYFWQELEKWADTPALETDIGSVTYEKLAEAADAFAREVRHNLPKDITRPLILLEVDNSKSAVVCYLAALRARWPVILVADGTGGPESAVFQTFQPNVFITASSGWKPQMTGADQAMLDPELAVMLSTSGTTGTAKLVRLSCGNLQANADAIITYLNVKTTDCAITALPFHYSYGMSVLHIHLAAGARLVLSEASVVDDDFWVTARAHGVTSLAMVPTQYELLEGVRFSRKTHLPSLRYMTQAGGRLDPERIQKVAVQSADEGWQFFTMYGQTEAGPRISYVPPEDATTWGHTIGRAINGTDLKLIDENGATIRSNGTRGELVARGPSVMMGYAAERADLALPQGTNQLKTGDIAERLENGYFRIVGRKARFVKLFGLRIGLDDVEAKLSATGNLVYASGSDQGLVLFVTSPPKTDIVSPDTLDLVKTRAVELFKLPARAISVIALAKPPLLPSGKVNYAALNTRAEEVLSAPGTTQSLLSVLQIALRNSDLDLATSFADSGGDSLAYLEVQMYLTDHLGHVPPHWENMSLRDLLILDAEGPDQSVDASHWQTTDPDLIGRIIALLMVIALHSTTWSTGGGAYLLLILSGYSLARFQSKMLFSGKVLRVWSTMLLPLTICYYFLITVTNFLWAPIDPRWFFMIGNFIETTQLKGMVPYWFVCTYLQIIVLLSLPFLFQSIRDGVARAPFTFGLGALLGVAVVMEAMGLSELGYPVRHRHPISALELFLLGWGVYFADNLPRRLTMIVVLYFVYFVHWIDADPQIGIVALLGTSMTLLSLKVRLPRWLSMSLMRIGSSTMFIYLIHTPVISIVSKTLPLMNWLQFTSTVACAVILAWCLKAFFNSFVRYVGRL